MVSRQRWPDHQQVCGARLTETPLDYSLMRMVVGRHQLLNPYIDTVISQPQYLFLSLVHRDWSTALLFPNHLTEYLYKILDCRHNHNKVEYRHRLDMNTLFLQKTHTLSYLNQLHL